MWSRRASQRVLRLVGVGDAFRLGHVSSRPRSDSDDPPWDDVSSGFGDRGVALLGGRAEVPRIAPTAAQLMPADLAAMTASTTWRSLRARASTARRSRTSSTGTYVGCEFVVLESLGELLGVIEDHLDRTGHGAHLVNSARAVMAWTGDGVPRQRGRAENVRSQWTTRSSGRRESSGQSDARL